MRKQLGPPFARVRVQRLRGALRAVVGIRGAAAALLLAHHCHAECDRVDVRARAVVRNKRGEKHDGHVAHLGVARLGGDAHERGGQARRVRGDRLEVHRVPDEINDAAQQVEIDLVRRRAVQHARNLGNLGRGQWRRWRGWRGRRGRDRRAALVGQCADRCHAGRARRLVAALNSAQQERRAA